MQDAEVGHLRDEIVRLLREAEGRPVLGAVLGNRLRSRTGRTVKDLGFLHLRDFVQRHLPDEVKVTQAEFDVAFALASLTPGDVAAAGATLGSQVSEELTNIDLRRVWKNPRGYLTIVVRRTDGAVRAMPRGVSAGEDEVALASPSADDHKLIARGFLEAHVPEDKRTPFAATLETAEKWWEEWDPLFQDPGPNLRKEWLRFREKGLFDRLDKALRDAGLTEDAVANARGAFDRARALSPVRTRSSLPPPRGAGTLRQGLLEAIAHMSEEELRRVWVPAGLLYDALVEKR
jgi:hypothetical protein